jgi:hypothetical protein
MPLVYNAQVRQCCPHTRGRQGSLSAYIGKVEICTMQTVVPPTHSGCCEVKSDGASIEPGTQQTRNKP